MEINKKENIVCVVKIPTKTRADRKFNKIGIDEIEGVLLWFQCLYRKECDIACT